MRRQTLAIVLRVSVVFSIGMSEFWNKTRAKLLQMKLNSISFILFVFMENALFSFMHGISKMLHHYVTYVHLPQARQKTAHF